MFQEYSRTRESVSGRHHGVRYCGRMHIHVLCHQRHWLVRHFQPPLLHQHNCCKLTMKKDYVAVTHTQHSSGLFAFNTYQKELCDRNGFLEENILWILRLVVSNIMCRFVSHSLLRCFYITYNVLNYELKFIPDSLT